MIFNLDSAEVLADFLLQIKAIKLQPKNPFTWASGIKSPIYCDNRVIMSYPEIRSFVRSQMTTLIEKELPKPDVVVGVATGGIAIGALVADALELPFAYVRSSGKGHGMKNQIEGVVKSGDRVLVIEDLISTGGSSLAAVKVLREAGCVVDNMIAIFTYGFDIATKAFEKENVQLITLGDYPSMLKKAVAKEYVNEGELEHLNAWRTDPNNWLQN